MFRRQLLDQGMVGVNFHNRFSLGCCLSHGLENALEIGSHVVFISDETGGGIRQATTHSNGFNAVPKGLSHFFQ